MSFREALVLKGGPHFGPGDAQIVDSEPLAERVTRFLSTDVRTFEGTAAAGLRCSGGVNEHFDRAA